MNPQSQSSDISKLPDFRKKATGRIPQHVAPAEEATGPEPRKLDGRIPRPITLANQIEKAVAPLPPYKADESDSIRRMRQETQELLDKYGDFTIPNLDERYDVIRALQDDAFNEATGHAHTAHYFPNKDRRDQLLTRRPEIARTILEKLQSRVLLLTSETGSGKSTEIPPLVYWDMIARDNKPYSRIVCTQPKRLLAGTLFGHVAANVDSKPGDVIGLSVRGRRTEEPGAAIMYMTDGTLLAEVQHDPEVLATKYSVVIIDEAHERTQAIDLLLHFLKREILSEGSTLRLVIMSATLAHDIFFQFFKDCQVASYDITGPGPYPVADRYLEEEPRDDKELDHWTFLLIGRLIEKEKDMLIFLPGQPEIAALQAKLEDRLQTFQSAKPVRIYPLYSRQEQRASDAATQSHLKKGQEIRVILATNIAESGVTLPGIAAVVDTGRMKLDQFDHATWTDSLNTQQITRSSVRQRRGRVGRTEPGEFYTMYTRAAVDRMQENQTPALLRQCLLSEQLRLLRIYPGVRLDDLDLPEPLDPRSVVHCKWRLLAHGCVDPSGRLTKYGRMAASLPCDLPFAIMMLKGAYLNAWARSFAICVAAAFDVGDPHRLLRCSRSRLEKSYMDQYRCGDLQMYGEIGLDVLRPQDNFAPNELPWWGRDERKLVRDLGERARLLSLRLEGLTGRTMIEDEPYDPDARDSYIVQVIGPALKLQAASFYRPGKDPVYHNPTTQISGTIDPHSIVSARSYKDFQHEAKKLPYEWARNKADQLDREGLELSTFFYAQAIRLNVWDEKRSVWVATYRFKGILIAPLEEIQRLNPAFKAL